MLPYVCTHASHIVQKCGYYEYLMVYPKIRCQKLVLRYNYTTSILINNTYSCIYTHAYRWTDTHTYIIHTCTHYRYLLSTYTRTQTDTQCIQTHILL